MKCCHQLNFERYNICDKDAVCRTQLQPEGMLCFIYFALSPLTPLFLSQGSEMLPHLTDIFSSVLLCHFCYATMSETSAENCRYAQALHVTCCLQDDWKEQQLFLLHQVKIMIHLPAFLKYFSQMECHLEVTQQCYQHTFICGLK